MGILNTYLSPLQNLTCLSPLFKKVRAVYDKQFFQPSIRFIFLTKGEYHQLQDVFTALLLSFYFRFLNWFPSQVLMSQILVLYLAQIPSWSNVVIVIISVGIKILPVLSKLRVADTLITRTDQLTQWWHQILSSHKWRKVSNRKKNQEFRLLKAVDLICSLQKLSSCWNRNSSHQLQVSVISMIISMISLKREIKK
jgi:hypothetical protein